MTTTADPLPEANAGLKLAAFILAVTGATGIALALHRRSADLADWDEASNMAAASGIFGGIQYGPPGAPSLAGPAIIGIGGGVLMLMAFVIVVALGTRR